MKVIMLGLLAAAGMTIGAQGALAAGSVERGDYLVNTIMGCGNCHTPIGAQGFDASMALGGRVVEDGPAFTAVAKNITPGGGVKDWSDADLGRAIREGIRPDTSPPRHRW